MTERRERPQDEEAERWFLGSFMCQVGTPDYTALSEVTEEDFKLEAHRAIYRAMTKLVAFETPVDIMTLSNKLAQMHALNGMGGSAYIVDLAESIPTPAHARHYAKIVRDSATWRRLRAVALPGALEGCEDATQAIGQLRRHLDAIERGQGGFEPKSALDVAKAIDERIRIALDTRTNYRNIKGISTGIEAIDKALSGLQRRKMIIIAGRPSMGKTALALSIFSHLVSVELADTDESVGFFSLDSDAEELGERIVSNESGVALEMLSDKSIDPEQLDRVTGSLGRIGEGKWWCDDRGSITIDELVATAQRKHAKRPVRAIFVDYIQQIDVAPQPTGRRNAPQRFMKNREQEVSEVSKKLRALGKSLGCTMIVLSQLNRGVEMRPNKRPTMSDLRDSGAIEQDADAVIFPFREWEYNKNKDPHVALLDFAKNKLTGKRGDVPVRWVPEQARYTSAAPAQQKKASPGRKE